jgi:hypothetical protein
MNAGAPGFCRSIEFTIPKAKPSIDHGLEGGILNPSGDQKAFA